jgi:four helix bundle protein
MNLTSNYKEAFIWRKSMDLAIAINSTVRDFPDSEKQYRGLSCQLLQAAIRIPSRVAESFEPMLHNPGEMLQMARFHLSETEFLLDISAQLGFVQQDNQFRLQEVCLELREQINRMIRRVEKREVYIEEGF